MDIQELLTPFPYATLDNLFSPEEKNAILLMRPALRDLYVYSMFSAKESVLKCCYYAFDCLLELNNINITMQLDQNIFFAQILDHSIRPAFTRECNPVGHIYFDKSHVYSGFWLSGKTENAA